VHRWYRQLRLNLVGLEHQKNRMNLDYLVYRLDLVDLEFLGYHIVQVYLVDLIHLVLRSWLLGRKIRGCLQD